ncbi:helix-turn-helix domain-containing protein [Peribacillus sp. SI8-4]|uniref:PucR family transcriptional regulator n=1 Tax=Peribacillus sp. SI8-4 TaxID=3048009 RepID=UPI00255584BE|nr:helix-turn-helix domain-containing protein [Peribacillus sp. SI8-4]
MLENLKQKFPNAISNKANANNSTEYVWYEDPMGNGIGIPRFDISAEEIHLLELLFPSSLNQADLTSFSGTSWNTFLTDPNAPLPLTSWENVRFIHFKLSHADFSQTDFEDAFLAFVPSDAALIWDNDTEGILIETHKGEALSYNDLLAISSTLESDFYVKTRMFTGRFHLVNQELQHHRIREKRCFTLAQAELPDLKVTDLADIIPYILLNRKSDADMEWYIQQILGKTRHDTELIKTIKTYMECNSNATLAAKRLYIHRNSLQYRIDKFIDRTGLDIRNFRHALTAYLLVLLND